MRERGGRNKHMETKASGVHGRLHKPGGCVETRDPVPGSGVQIAFISDWGAVKVAK